jgi:hypothetical protein
MFGSLCGPQREPKFQWEHRSSTYRYGILLYLPCKIFYLIFQFPTCPPDYPFMYSKFVGNCSAIIENISVTSDNRRPVLFIGAVNTTRGLKVLRITTTWGNEFVKMLYSGNWRKIIHKIKSITSCPLAFFLKLFSLPVSFVLQKE